MSLKRIVYISNNERISLVMRMLNISTTFLTTNVKSCAIECKNHNCNCVKSPNKFFIHEALHHIFPSDANVLYHHFDMYIDPRILKKNIINVAKPFRCLTPSELNDDHNWTWAMGAKQKCLIFMERYGVDRCCEGWSDLFYFPKYVIPEIQRAFKLSPGGFMNEALMPTAVNKLSYHALGCIGSCCTEVNLSYAKEKGCGHRIHLQ